jgi:tetratricopeptide (TPR) repeat protein
LAKNVPRPVTHEKCKVLLLAANPVNRGTLDLDEEIHEIETKIRMAEYRDAVEFIPKVAVRPDDLQQYLLQYLPRVVHFSGHGTKCNEIVLKDSQGKAKSVSGKALKGLFREFRGNVRGVVLNACYSEGQAKAITEVLDFAIGMNDAIRDDAAIVFAASFYRAIGFNSSVGEAYRLAVNALDIEGIPQANVPVLLVREGVDADTIYLLGLEPPRPPVVHNVPYLSLGDWFKGREEVLKDLERGLAEGGAAAITQVQAVHGLGGIGKTRLAVEYAWRAVRNERYGAVLFVRADSPEGLRSNLAGLAKEEALNLPEKQAKDEEEQYQAVLRWLRDGVPVPRPDAGNKVPWLLVFDNADTEEAARALEDLLPVLTRGHVLITSRLRRWSAAVRLRDLGLLSPADAKDFLLDRTAGRRVETPDDAALAGKLAELLGRLPLALEQAAAYIGHQCCTFARYVEEWDAERERVLEWYDEQEMMKYPASVAVTWQRTFDRLKPFAKAMLRLAAFLAPDPIPLAMFEEGSGIVSDAVKLLVGKKAAAHGASPMLDAIGSLAAYCLITRQEKTFTVHRMVQEVIRTQVPPKERRAWIEKTLHVVNGYAPEESDDVRTWPVLDVLRPHAEVVAGLADDAGIVEPTTRLMSVLGTFLHYKGLYKEAERWKRRALEIDEASFGPDHPEVATDLNNLAQLLKATNRLSEAEPMMRRALEIGEASFGSDHPEVATDLNNLAGLLKDTNRLSEAEPLYRRALEIDEASFGPHHPNVARDLNNLALLLKATNRLSEAEPMMRRVLEIGEASFGPDHPTVAIRLNNLAGLLQATNRLSEAEPMAHRALEIDEASFGPDHPNVARDLNNLALLLQATNRLPEAEPLYRRALEIDEASFGPDHPNVARDLNNLALLLQDTNRLSEAEPLYRRALEIDEASFGPDHPNVAIRLHNLALLLQDTNRLSEAEPMMCRALEISEKSLGTDHPNTRTVRENYESLLIMMGNEGVEADE